VAPDPLSQTRTLLKLVIGAITLTTFAAVAWLIHESFPDMAPRRVGIIVVGAGLAVGMGCFAVADKFGLLKATSEPESTLGLRE